MIGTILSHNKQLIAEICVCRHIAGTKRPNDDLPMTPRRFPRKHGQ